MNFRLHFLLNILMTINKHHIHTLSRITKFPTHPSYPIYPTYPISKHLKSFRATVFLLYSIYDKIWKILIDNLDKVSMLISLVFHFFYKYHLTCLHFLQRIVNGQRLKIWIFFEVQRGEKVETFLEEIYTNLLSMKLLLIFDIWCFDDDIFYDEIAMIQCHLSLSYRSRNNVLK